MTDAADRSRRRTIATLYAIFFVSGFCGLIYESQPDQHRGAAAGREVFMTQGRALPADRFERPWFRYVALEMHASENAAARPAPATPRSGVQAKE